MMAASVTKLLTAIAVLDALGPGTRLTTAVTAERPPIEGVLGGDLWLVGGGDPVLGTATWAGRSGRVHALGEAG